MVGVPEASGGGGEKCVLRISQFSSSSSSECTIY